MEESVKVVIIHEDDVPANGDGGVELCDLAGPEVTGKDQPGTSNGNERGKLDENDDDNLKGLHDDGKNGESILGKI